MNFEVRLEKFFKQLEVLRFSVNCWHRCGKRFWQFGSSIDIVMEVCRIVDVCQLLKGQQNLVCFNRRRSNLAAELRLTGRAVLFLLSSKCTGRAVSGFLVNSCHRVVAIFWARVLCCLSREDAFFRMRITLGVVLICSVVCARCVLGRLRSSSGLALNYRVHERVVKT